MNNTLTHYRNIEAAQHALELAQQQLEQVRAEAAADFEIKPGDRIDGHTSAGGTPCNFEVRDISVTCSGNGRLFVCIHGWKIKKDGTTARIDCYKHVNINLQCVA